MTHHLSSLHIYALFFSIHQVYLDALDNVSFNVFICLFFWVFAERCRRRADSFLLADNTAITPEVNN